VLILMFFALLAGAGTALSPCVLPVLPAMLSASGSGGRRRPVGVVLGLTITFAVTIVGIAKVADGVGLGSDPLRYLAVGVLAVFGIAIAVPALAARLEAPLAGLSRLGPRTRGDGFASGLLVGGALGFVYTPCAGPILAAVISVSAASGRALAVGLAYAVGSGLALLVLGLGGRWLFERLRAAGRGPGLQRALGAVMVLTAIAIATMLDVKLDQQIARHIPNVSLTASLERSRAVEGRLSSLRGPSRFASVAAPSLPVVAASQLPRLGQAPDFTATQRWFNTPGGRPLTLAALRGHVVLIDFWTYTCINCIRTLPYLEAWDARYRAAGLEIVGVHTPEFAFEHDASNVASAIRTFGIRYPVVQDNAYGTWNAWGNEYWPADYLIDSTGQVRYATFGEGDYAKTEAAIRALLARSGHRALGGAARPRGVIVPSSQTTPETYLGTARAEGWVPVGPLAGTHTYFGSPRRLALNEFSYSGTWTIGAQQALAGRGATIDAEIQARNVYMVLSPPPGRSGNVEVLLDGRPIPPGQAGRDVRHGVITVSAQRLYNLVALRSDQRHHLTLRLATGTSGFSFTFG
jgi:cytochrome c biogenesis protein CcdA/thiol-disulfide isomerase/thioredoxin